MQLPASQPMSEKSCNALGAHWSEIEIQQPPIDWATRYRRFLVEAICLAGTVAFLPSRLLAKLRRAHRHAPRKVLIIRRGGIGDAAMLTPLARGIKEQFPGAQVYVLANSQAKGVLATNPFIDRLVQVPQGRQQWIELVRSLRKERIDTAFVLHRFFAVPVLVALCGIPRRLGFRWKRHGFALTSSVSFDAKKAQVPQICSLMELLGFPAPAPVPELFLSEQDRADAAQRLKEWGYDPARQLIGIHPGGSEIMGGAQHYQNSAANEGRADFHPPRRWMPEHLAELADRLIEEGNQVLILRGPGDDAAVAAMQKYMRRPPFYAAPLMPLLTFAAILEACDQVVASDSGPMHLAVAVKTPVVGIFGPTHPAYTGPLGPQDRIAWAGVSCAPCFHPEEFAIANSWKGKKPFHCALGTNDCMRQLMPDQVHKLVQVQTTALRKEAGLQSHAR